MKVETLIEQAQLLIDNENYEKAFQILKSAHESDKKNVEILEKLALLSQTMEMPNEAMYYWEELIDNDPDSMVAHSELQDLYFHQDKYKYYLSRAKVKTLNENISQAVPDYKKAIDNTTDEKNIIEARFLLAKSYEFLGKIQNAIDEYLRILDLEDNLIIYYKLAELYSLEDKYTAVDILLRAVEAYPNEGTLKELLSGLLIETNQLDKAMEYAQSDLTKAKIYLMKQENAKAYEILAAFESKTMPEYLVLMAEYYFNVKDFDNCNEKIEEFQKIDSLNPLVYQMKALVCSEKNDTFNEHYNWGRYYLLKKDTAVALNEFIQAHHIKPDSAEIIKEIIKIYENNGDKNSILEFYEKLLKVDSNNQDALKNMAKFYAGMYEFKDALTYYNKLIELNTKDNQIYYEIGYCYEKLKNNVLAKEFYQKYLEKAPLTPDVEKLKVRLSKLSDDVAEEDEGFLDKIMKFFTK